MTRGGSLFPSMRSSDRRRSGLHGSRFRGLTLRATSEGRLASPVSHFFLSPRLLYEPALLLENSPTEPLLLVDLVGFRGGLSVSTNRYS